jgi:hypothetical protein
VVEQIAAKLAEYVDGITTAAGFNQDLTAVRPKRIHLETDIDADGVVIIAQQAGQQDELSDEQVVWRQAFVLQALIIDSDRATEPIDTRLNKVRSDIEKQLASTAHKTCDGLAEGILLNGAEPLYGNIGGAECSGIAVGIEVIYHCNYT